MKTTGRCPKCDGRKFYLCEQPRCPVETIDQSGSADLALAHVEAPTGKRGLFGEERAQFSALVEAWVCAGCGYAELYARHLEVLAHLVEHSDEVRLVEGDPAQGPFR